MDSDSGRRVFAKSSTVTDWASDRWGSDAPMSHDASMSDDDITSGPTESEDNLDAPGEHSKDTGDEPTEADENLDAPGEHSRDTGDES